MNILPFFGVGAFIALSLVTTNSPAEVSVPAEAQPLSGTDAHGNYTDEREICGPSGTTPELNNVRCGARNGCQCISDGKWCFLPTSLSVSTPNSKWVFSAPAHIQCVRDNQGSCGWNALGQGDRFFVDLNNPTEIHAHALTNSRSIDIRICANARFYP